MVPIGSEEREQKKEREASQVKPQRIIAHVLVLLTNDPLAACYQVALSTAKSAFFGGRASTDVPSKQSTKQRSYTRPYLSVVPGVLPHKEGLESAGRRPFRRLRFVVVVVEDVTRVPLVALQRQPAAVLARRRGTRLLIGRRADVLLGAVFLARQQFRAAVVEF